VKGCQEYQAGKLPPGGSGGRDRVRRGGFTGEGKKVGAVNTEKKNMAWSEKESESQQKEKRGGKSSSVWRRWGSVMGG